MRFCLVLNNCINTLYISKGFFHFILSVTEHEHAIVTNFYTFISQVTAYTKNGNIPERELCHYRLSWHPETKNGKAELGR